MMFCDFSENTLENMWWNPILDYIFANLKKTDEIIVNLRYT